MEARDRRGQFAHEVDFSGNRFSPIFNFLPSRLAAMQEVEKNFPALYRALSASGNKKRRFSEGDSEKFPCLQVCEGRVTDSLPE